MASVFRFEEAEAARRAARSAAPSAPVARPRVDVAATQEIQVDDILDAADAIADTRSASVAPVEIDIEVELPPPPVLAPVRRTTVADSTMQIILDLTRVVRPIPKRRLGWVVAAAVGVAALILVAGVTRRALSSSDDDTRATLAAMVGPRATNAAPPSAPAKAPPAASTPSLAPSPVGTVIGPAARVYIDGTRARDVGDRPVWRTPDPRRPR